MLFGTQVCWLFDFQNLEISFCSSLFPGQFLSISEWKFHRLGIERQFARSVFFVVIPIKPSGHLKNILFFILFIVNALCKAACHVLSPRVAICKFRSLYFSVSENHFPTSGAPRRTMLAPRNHPRGPREQQDGLEVVVYTILFDLGLVLGPVYIGFLLSRS